MKRYTFLILLFLINLPVFAQVKCVVKDSLTKQVIPFATIYLENTKESLITNENGEFTISHLNNNLKVSVTSVGYQKKSILEIGRAHV